MSLLDQYMVKKTQIEMMKDRGYLNADPRRAEIERNFENDAVKKIFTTEYISNAQAIDQTKVSLTDIYYRDDNVTKQRTFTYVFYPKIREGDKHLKRDHIITFLEIMRTNNIKTGIIICDLPTSTQSKQDLDSLTGRIVQIFKRDELLYNPTRHQLSQKFILLSNDEKAKFLEDNNANIGNIPKIKSTDPIVKYYGWVTGDILRIERDIYYLETLVKNPIYYRTVII